MFNWWGSVRQVDTVSKNDYEAAKDALISKEKMKMFVKECLKAYSTPECEHLLQSANRDGQNVQMLLESEQRRVFRQIGVNDDQGIQSLRQYAKTYQNDTFMIQIFSYLYVRETIEYNRAILSPDEFEAFYTDSGLREHITTMSKINSGELPASALANTSLAQKLKIAGASALESLTLNNGAAPLP